MSAPAPIRCVLFDVGGVLVELGGIQPMLDWMRNRTDVAGLWRAWLASDAVREFERGRVDVDTFAARAVGLQAHVCVGPHAVRRVLDEHQLLI